MTKFYVALALSDSMSPPRCAIEKFSIGPHEAQAFLREAATAGRVVSAVNASHKATIDAVRQRFGIDLPLPASGDPPKVLLDYDDEVLVVSVRGLPRLTDRHQYTADEIARAEIVFSIYRCLPIEDLNRAWA
jgi:hypothetical protein